MRFESYIFLIMGLIGFVYSFYNKAITVVGNNINIRYISLLFVMFFLIDFAVKFYWMRKKRK